MLYRQRAQLAKRGGMVREFGGAAGDL